ncbi:DUF1440 domain-containing protein [Escherichia coli]|nr:DUF1440 domain-containing protein [Escherichia coli]
MSPRQPSGKNIIRWLLKKRTNGSVRYCQYTSVYTFAGHVFNWVGVTHIIFSIVFAVGYCVVAEVFPKIKLWQGLLAGALAQLFVHMISFPLMGLTPPLFDLPWYENVSEIFGHLVWFWSIEIIRRDLRNRITHEPDPEIPLGSNR